MHQWYWSYQYPDFLDSEDQIRRIWFIYSTRVWFRWGRELRMLEVDNRVILPELTHVRFIITAGDVIHDK